VLVIGRVGWRVLVCVRPIPWIIDPGGADAHGLDGPGLEPMLIAMDEA